MTFDAHSLGSPLLRPPLRDGQPAGVQPAPPQAELPTSPRDCLQLGLAAWLKGGSVGWQQAVVCEPPPRPECEYLLWVHGASVGETMSSLPVVRALLKRDAASSVLITASTQTALERLALEELGPRVVLQSRPVDSPSVVRRFLMHWRPSSLLIVESELWPSLLMGTHEAGVPIALVNARLSQTTAARWSATEASRESIRFLLSICSVVLAQSPSMQARLRNLGASRAAYVGDLKQLPNTTPPCASTVQALHARLTRPDDIAHDESASHSARRRVWLAASTHEGEEGKILDAHLTLRAAHLGLLLLLAPRHPQR